VTNLHCTSSLQSSCQVSRMHPRLLAAVLLHVEAVPIAWLQVRKALAAHAQAALLARAGQLSSAVAASQRAREVSFALTSCEICTSFCG